MSRVVAASRASREVKKAITIRKQEGRKMLPEEERRDSGGDRMGKPYQLTNRGSQP